MNRKAVSLYAQRLPIDAMDMAEAMLGTKCPACGSGTKGMKLDQSPEAFAWYDANVRPSSGAAA